MCLIWLGVVLTLLFPHEFFSQKSENVTFLGLLQANLMQKIRKTNVGKYDNFCDGLTSEGRVDLSVKVNGK